MFGSFQETDEAMVEISFNFLKKKNFDQSESSWSWGNINECSEWIIRLSTETENKKKQRKQQNKQLECSWTYLVLMSATFQEEPNMLMDFEK